MPHRSLLTLLLVVIALAPTVACDDGATCDDADLRARLAAASPGDTVLAGACTFTGPFVVPAGVSLEGAGATSTTIVAPADGRALTLTPSGAALAPTAARSLGVESADGCAAIVAIGEGAVTVVDVDVRAGTGVGVAIEGTTTAILDGVDIGGPVTAESAETTMAPLPPFVCGSGVIATHGLVLVDVASARVTGGSATGFGRFGLLAIRSVIVIDGLTASTNLGAGIEIWGGDAQLASTSVEATSDGAGAIETFGIVAAGGAVVDTAFSSAQGGDGYGLFVDGAMTTNDSFTASGNGFAGVWVQNAASFALTGTTRVSDNAFAGVALFDSTAASIEDAEVMGTRSGIAISGVGTVTGADGVHASASELSLTRVSFVDNARVGAVLDLNGDSTAAVTLAEVSVDASGAALGVVAQNGTTLMGWDDGVTRLGDTAANDAAFSGALEIAEGVGPPCLPPLDGIDGAGLGALVGL